MHSEASRKELLHALFVPFANGARFVVCWSLSSWPEVHHVELLV